MIKLLLVNFSFTLGGAEVLMEQLAATLPRDSFDTEVMIINDYYDDEMVRRLLQEAVPIHLMKRATSADMIGNLIHMWKTIKVLNKKKYDIVHCHTPGAVLWMFVAKLLSFSRFRIVLTLHSVDLIDRKPIHLLTARIADKIIAISQAVLSDIKKVDPLKGSLIYNGVPLEKFKRKCVSSGTSVIIGNVARVMVNTKGQDILVCAVAELIRAGYDVSCWLIGEDLSGGYETNDLKKLAGRLEISDHIFFKGKHLDMNSILDSIDIFVLPSRVEGFGLALVEAMAKGIPVIASDLHGPREIIVSGENGFLFPVGDAKALCNIIKMLISDKTVAKRIAQAGMERAKSFTLDKMIKEHINLYADL